MMDSLFIILGEDCSRLCNYGHYDSENSRTVTLGTASSTDSG
ncbi:MAG TPA: hypothetical protein PKV80_16715 [Leptospiraceae bacterium]|nr:hypothetical protein [Leptospiraceae bacterium]HNO22401.1 hypothetical protein [Leptospiraceae bacterium]